MRNRLVPALALLALAACDTGTSPESGRLTDQEVAVLSDGMVDADFALTGEVAAAADGALDEGVLAAPVTATTEFTATRACPAGGQIVVEGTHVRVRDRETHSGSSDLAMTKTHEGCARPVGDGVITVDGDPDIQVAAHHAWLDGRRDGLQTLTMQGAFTWHGDDGREGRCVVDVSATFDPESRTRTVSGTFCNRTFERTTTWTGGASGMGGMGA